MKEKLKLPDVTLICLTNKDFEGHKKALDKSCEGIEFGAVKLIWDEKITNIDEWNYKIVFDLWKYVDTDYALLIHADGHVINPEIWNKRIDVTPNIAKIVDQYGLNKWKTYPLGALWMHYDYVGAPWPLPQDDYSYRDSSGSLIRVGNSVSLRSKKLLDAFKPETTNYNYFKKKFFEVEKQYGNTNEDGFICCHTRDYLISQYNCKFAPLEVAVSFSKEHEIDENVGLETFAFHHVD